MFSYKVQAGELITAVPYLLSAQPRDEVVLLGEQDSRLATITALPLDAKELIGLSLRAFARSGITSCVAIGFADAGDVVAPLIHAVQVAKQVGIAASDILIVSDGRWAAHTDTAPETHAVPPAGRLVAELVGLGFAVTGQPHARRLDLAPAEQLAAVDAHIDKLIRTSTASQICARAQEIMHRADQQSYPNARETADLILAAAAPPFRLEAIGTVMTSPTPRALADLWWWVMRHALGPTAAPVAVVSALATWHSDDLDRADRAAEIATSAALAWPAGIYTSRFIASSRTPARDEHESE